MIAFFTFLTAALIVTLGARLANQSSSERSSSLFPLFVVAILMAAAGGWAADTVLRLDEPLSATQTITQAVGSHMMPSTGFRRNIPPDGYLFLIAAALCFLAAIRMRLNLPAWIADVLVVWASLVALVILGLMRMRYSESPPNGPFFGLTATYFWLTLFFMWLITRLTTALNRVPQASGGYFGSRRVAHFAILAAIGRAIFLFSFCRWSRHRGRRVGNGAHRVQECQVRFRLARRSDDQLSLGANCRFWIASFDCANRAGSLAADFSFAVGGCVVLSCAAAPRWSQTAFARRIAGARHFAHENRFVLQRRRCLVGATGLFNF